MIVEVGIGGALARRYAVRRDGGRIILREVDSPGNPGSNGAGEVSIDWRRPQAGIYSLLVDGASYEVFIEDAAEDWAVHVLNRTFRVRAHDVRRHQVAAEVGGAGDGTSRIAAPIPGRVARVLVCAGQEVTRGDGIVVLEAMKMENELRAPRDGVVASIEVVEGQGVQGGALLATIE